MQLSYFFFGFVYAITQFEERWVRWRSRRWLRTTAEVTSQTRSGGQFSKMEIAYQYQAGDELQTGCLFRMYASSRMFQAEPTVEPGTKIEILVDPRDPERSYYPLYLDPEGLIYTTPAVLLVLGLACALILPRLATYNYERGHRIPEQYWHAVPIAPKFNVTFPSAPSLTAGKGDELGFDGNVPLEKAWWSPDRRFAAIVYDYRLPPKPEQVFALLRRYPYGGTQKTRTPKERELVWRRFVKWRLLIWPYAIGRSFEFPDAHVRIDAYVDGRTVYILVSDWHIGLDVSRFMDSLDPVGDPGNASAARDH